MKKLIDPPANASPAAVELRQAAKDFWLLRGEPKDYADTEGHKRNVRLLKAARAYAAAADEAEATPPSLKHLLREGRGLCNGDEFAAGASIDKATCPACIEIMGKELLQRATFFGGR